MPKHIIRKIILHAKTYYMPKHIICKNILYAKTHYRFKIHCIAEANLHEGCVTDQKTLQSMNVSYQSYHGVFFLCYGNESSATCLHDCICVSTANQRIKLAKHVLSLFISCISYMSLISGHCILPHVTDFSYPYSLSAL